MLTTIIIMQVQLIIRATVSGQKANWMSYDDIDYLCFSFSMFSILIYFDVCSFVFKYS